MDTGKGSNALSQSGSEGSDNDISGWADAIPDAVGKDNSQHCADQAIADAFGSSFNRKLEPGGVPPTIIQSASVDSSPLITLESMDSATSDRKDELASEQGAENPWLDVVASSSSKGSQGSYADQVPALSGSGSAGVEPLGSRRSDLGSPWTLPDSDKEKASPTPSTGGQENSSGNAKISDGLSDIQTITDVSRSERPALAQVMSEDESKQVASAAPSEQVNSPASQFQTSHARAPIHTRDSMDDILGPNTSGAATASVQVVESMDEILGPKSSVAVSSVQPSESIDEILGPNEARTVITRDESRTIMTRETEIINNQSDGKQALDYILGPKGGPSYLTDQDDSLLDGNTTSVLSASSVGFHSAQSSLNAGQKQVIGDTGARYQKPDPILIPHSSSEQRTEFSTASTSDRSGTTNVNKIAASLDNHRVSQTRPPRPSAEPPRAQAAGIDSFVSESSTFESGASSPSQTPHSGVSEAASSWSDSRLHPGSPSSYSQDASTSPDATSFSNNDSAFATSYSQTSPDATSFSRNTFTSEDGTSFSRNTSMSEEATSFSRNSALSPGGTSVLSPSETECPSDTDAFSPTSAASYSRHTYATSFSRHTATSASYSLGGVLSNDTSAQDGMTDGPSLESGYSASGMDTMGVASPGGMSAMTGFFTAQSNDTIPSNTLQNDTGSNLQSVAPDNAVPEKAPSAEEVVTKTASSEAVHKSASAEIAVNRSSSAELAVNHSVSVGGSVNKAGSSEVSVNKSASAGAETTVNKSVSMEDAANKAPSLEVAMNKSASSAVAMSMSASSAVAMNSSPSSEVAMNKSASSEIAMNKSPSSEIAMNKSPSSEVSVNKSASGSVAGVEGQPAVAPVEALTPGPFESTPSGVSRNSLEDASRADQPSVAQQPSAEPLWEHASEESDVGLDESPRKDAKSSSRFAESLMARTRSRADPSAVMASSSASLGGSPPGKSHMVRVGEENDEKFIMNTAVARKRVRVVQLLSIGLLGLLVAFLGSFWVQSSCHFVSAAVEVGAGGQTFDLHYGLWKYTPVDSVFNGYSYCSMYDDMFTFDSPIIARFASTTSMLLGAFSLAVLWLYLILGRGSKGSWSLAARAAGIAGVLQLLTLTVFLGPVCQRDECTLGPAGFLSVVSGMVYFVLAFEMHYNSPVQAWLDDIPDCPSYEKPHNMVTHLEMRDFRDGATAYVGRIVNKDDGLPTLNQIQRNNEDPIGEAMFERDLAKGTYQPPNIV